MRLRRFLISEPMAARTLVAHADTRAQSARTREGIGRARDRGWCNGSTGSFGVPSRGSKPRPRATSALATSTTTTRRRGRPCPVSTDARSSAVVLAAGEGTRMRSDTPKVLHPLCGRPMVLHVVDALAALPLDRIVVVVGHGAEDVTKTIQEQLVTEVPVEFVEQTRPARHRRRGQRRPHRVQRRARRRGRRHRAVRRRAAPARRDPRHARDRAPPRRRRRDPPHRPRRRPDRLRPRRPRRQRPRRPHRRGARRVARGARDRRGQPVDLLLPPRPARAGAAPPRAPRTRRASTTSPT